MERSRVKFNIAMNKNTNNESMHDLNRKFSSPSSSSPWASYSYREQAIPKVYKPARASDLSKRRTTARQNSTGSTNSYNQRRESDCHQRRRPSEGSFGRRPSITTDTKRRYSSASAYDHRPSSPALNLSRSAPVTRTSSPTSIEANDRRTQPIRRCTSLYQLRSDASSYTPPKPNVIVIRKVPTKFPAEDSHSLKSSGSGGQLSSSVSSDRGRSLLRRRNGSRDSSLNLYRGDDDTIESLSTRSTSSVSDYTTCTINRLSRKITLIIMGMLGFWGLQLGFGIVRSTVVMMINVAVANQIEELPLDKSGAPARISLLENDIVPRQRQQAAEQSGGSLRGSAEPAAKKQGASEFSTEEEMGGMSHHRHKQKPRNEETESLDTQDDGISTGRSSKRNEKTTRVVEPEETDIDDEESLEDTEGYQPYMGQDATQDFFFAGESIEQEETAKKGGKIETINYPVHTYATLPFSFDANPFVVSLWIFLTPNSSTKTQGDHEDSRSPRVILSTKTKDKRGCSSDLFGGPATSGMTLYAQPHHEDNHKSSREGGDSANSKKYRIAVEYATVENDRCHTFVAANKKAHIVNEGEWHHVVLFVTPTLLEAAKSDVADERISVFVDGDLAGRENYVPMRYPSRGSNVKTIVGHHVLQGHNSKSEQDSKSFDLGGRIGMLSFWEVGDLDSIGIQYNKMIVQSERDKEHIVRAVNRAAFDVRALKELSLQGLTVKEPTLLYTFDGQEENVSEVMSGRNGAIVKQSPKRSSRDASTMKRKFKPLGGNRYAEYRNGAFMPPGWSESERKELDNIARARKIRTKEAMKHAWSGYKQYAWGYDELAPITGDGHDNCGGIGSTLVDSLSTLWIMGMKNEFWEARDWVRDYLSFDSAGAVSVFEMTTRHLGGLLSAYDLSGDVVFLEKADDLAKSLLNAFNTPHGVPYGETDLASGNGRSYNSGWHQDSAVLSEVGSLQVEFRYLARVTGKTEYATIAMRALDEVLKMNPENGLFPTLINNMKHMLSFGNKIITVGSAGGSFYEYLLKVWLQGNKSENRYRRFYDKAIDGVMEKLVHMSRPSYLTYVAEMRNDDINHMMSHSSCFLGGNLVLGAYTHPSGLDSPTAQRHLKAGKQLAYTCYQMYARSKSGLSPENVSFDDGKDDFLPSQDSPFFRLTADAVETFYILYHLTKDPVYREWGWEVFQAIEEFCRTDFGYAAISDVETFTKDNRMESTFLSGTLKYLYLLQDDNADIDLLNEHVFNTRGHSLRVLNLRLESHS